MENNFSTYQYQKKKKVTRKVLAWVEIMTAQLVTYWVWLIFLKNYWLIAIDLSKQTKLKDPQQINFWKTWTSSPWSNNVFHHWKIRRNYFWIFTKFCKHLIKIETQKIVNLLNSSENEYLKFVTKNGTLLTVAILHEDPIKFFKKINRIKVFWLFWCVYLSHRKYSCNENLVSIHQGNMQTLHHQSVTQMVIWQGGKSHQVAVW